MDDPVATLDRLLDHERSAALRADVDVLVDIQEHKRAALERLTQADADDPRMVLVRSKAASNVHLIRHLVSCLNGILTPPGVTYTAHGRSPPSAYGRSRGHL